MDKIEGIKGNPIVQIEAARQAGILKKKKTKESKKNLGEAWNRDALGGQVGDKLDILRQTHIKILRSEEAAGVSNKMGAVDKKDVKSASRGVIALFGEKDTKSVITVPGKDNVVKKSSGEGGVFGKNIVDKSQEKKIGITNEEAWDDFEIDNIDETNDIDNLDEIDDMDNLDNLDEIDDMDNLDNLDNLDEINDGTLAAKPGKLDETFGISIPDSIDVINIAKEYLNVQSGSYITSQGHRLYIYRDPKTNKGYFTVSVPLGDGTIEQISVLVNSDDPNSAQVFKRKIITPNILRK
ncbi:MAG: hypothetical protein K8T10_05655 [Candidatus Eremiobacteraeota bacterium]|nr:hypothetical protein [Candidatus Eremiobacteraeota bacterium]